MPSNTTVCVIFVVGVPYMYFIYGKEGNGGGDGEPADGRRRSFTKLAFRRL